MLRIIHQRFSLNYHARFVVVALFTWTTFSVCTGLTVAQITGANWTNTGGLVTPRFDHTATLLLNGKVLVASGVSSGPTETAELYDPDSGTWNATGSLRLGRSHFTATLLEDGRVLVVGGVTRFPRALTNTAELYDPTSGTWTPTGNLANPRVGHTATLLPDGQVLVVGGVTAVGNPFAFLSDQAELYNPVTGLWTTTGSLSCTLGRVGHTATLLKNGKVLVAGGTDNVYQAFTVDEEYGEGLASAELYDPATGTWSVTGSLNTGRLQHSATLLPNGNVLVAGGGSLAGALLIDMPDSAELYSPTTGAWTKTGNLNHRVYHTATLLPNGKVLVSGGLIFEDTRDSAEIYNPTTGTWATTANLNVPRAFHTATLLKNGTVLVGGGMSGCCSLPASAELYNAGSIANPIDDSQFFVSQHYLDFLNREPDPAGLSFWTNTITSCGMDQECLEVRRINVSAAFFLSIEFQETGFFVYLVYKAAFGNRPNTPVPIEFQELMADTREIANGVVVNQSGWQQVLENNKQSYMTGFTQRVRFTSLFQPTMSAEEFVDTLNRNAGDPLTAAQREQLVSMLSTGALSRAQVLRIVAQNGRFRTAEFNRAFVLMQYFGYLRRNPNDLPDGNFDGYNFWLDKLNTFNGNFVDAEMVKAFLRSEEYRSRF